MKIKLLTVALLISISYAYGMEKEISEIKDILSELPSLKSKAEEYLKDKQPKNKMELLNAILDAAAGTNNTTLAKRAISLGADINAISEGAKLLGRSWTPLILASIHGYNDLAKELIKAGANVNFKDNNGKTPLIFAAENGHKYIAQMLLSAGADINGKDNFGYTALKAAFLAGKEQLARMLFEAGADTK